jgi:hypothetical protein
MATRQTGADRLHGAAREEELDALEDVLRIDLTRGPSGNGDDDTQDETQRPGLRNDATTKKNA